MKSVELNIKITTNCYDEVVINNVIRSINHLKSSAKIFFNTPNLPKIVVNIQVEAEIGEDYLKEEMKLMIDKYIHKNGEGIVVNFI
jgi:hypothetical protein